MADHATILRPVQFLAIIGIALYLVPTGAHVAELASKMALAPADYMTAQQIYAGWSWFAIVIFAALVITAAHTWVVRADRMAFLLSLTAFIALAGTQAVFWTTTFPVNAATQSWTVMPEAFEAARRQWEYSHAVSAALTFLALVTIVWSALVSNPQSYEIAPIRTE